MTRHGYALLVGLLLCLVGMPYTVAEDPIVSLDTTRIDDAVLQEMERQSLVGVSIGIIRNNTIVYTQGYGVANRETNTPMSPKSIVNWASCSKPLVAIMAMQLVQEGKLDLEQPIVRYLPKLPSHLHNITTRQLLCHQSGVPHYANGFIFPGKYPEASDNKLDPLNSLSRFLNARLIFEPGAEMEYSSYAYVLLSAVVQSVGNAPLQTQVETRIVKPLGLTSFQLDVETDSQADWAVGYRVVGGEIKPQPEVAHYWKHGAGGYKSNVEDFARFTLAMLQSEMITHETSAMMWTRQTLNHGEETTYGLGVRVDGRDKTLKISHNGSQEETKTRLVFYPAEKSGMVVMCNTYDCDPGRITTAIGRATAYRPGQ
jgi:serine beta-lactamase-like protein LACTB